MSSFIQANIVWLSPVISIILTVVLKLSNKPASERLTYIDWLDFGNDLSISSMIMVLTGTKNDAGIWLLLIYLVVLIVIGLITTRIGWDFEKTQKKLPIVIVADLVGIAIFVVSVKYVGGSIT